MLPHIFGSNDDFQAKLCPFPFHWKDQILMVVCGSKGFFESHLQRQVFPNTSRRALVGSPSPRDPDPLGHTQVSFILFFFFGVPEWDFIYQFKSRVVGLFLVLILCSFLIFKLCSAFNCPICNNGMWNAISRLTLASNLSRLCKLEPCCL